MNASSNTPGSRPAEATSSSRTHKAGLLDAVFRHAEEIYFVGGLALVLIGANLADSPHSTGPGAGLAGLGLCVAGGLCFVASAIVHGRDNPKQQ